jgi:hypothetical protein
MNIIELTRLHELALTYLKLIQNAKKQVEIMTMNNDKFGIGYDNSEIDIYKREIERLKVMYLKTVYELQHFEYGQDAI